MLSGSHARCQSLRCLNFYSNSLQPPSRVFFFLLGGLAVLPGSSPGANFRNGSDGEPGFLRIPCAGEKFEESLPTPKDGSLAQPAEGRVFLLEGGLPLRTFSKDGLPCGGGRPHFPQSPAKSDCSHLLNNCRPLHYQQRDQQNRGKGRHETVQRAQYLPPSLQGGQCGHPKEKASAHRRAQQERFLPGQQEYGQDVGVKPCSQKGN